ncbi:MAG: porin [Verrucomicrobiota bacterium]
MKSIQRAMLASSLLGCISAQAGTEPAAEAISSPSTATGLLVGKFPGETAYDKIWSAFTLYKDDTNPILQEFSLQGRLQVQYADGDSNGHFDIEDYKADGKDEAVWGDHFEARRARFGFKSKWFQNWKFEGQIDVDTDGLDGAGPDRTLYKDIYDLYVTYAPSDALNVSVGKQKVKFGREQEISSKEILTIERSLVSNLLFPGELTGAWVTGKGIQEHWLYELGVYGSDRVREFSEFDAGTVTLGKIGYDYSSQAGLDTAVASFHYMHNSQPSFGAKQTEVNFKGSNSPSFTDSIALTNDITQGRFGLTTDILYGFGFEGKELQNGSLKTIAQSDVFGISMIPSYYIADGLQLVGRLQWATSADNDDLSLPSRYENYAPPKPKKDTGDTYTSVYAGLNYYLYGHKLKVMTGIEYSMLGGGDYDGYTIMSGLRMSF